MNPMEVESASTEQETVNIPPALHHDPVSARQEIAAWEAMHREEKHELAERHAHFYLAGRILLGGLFLAMAWEKLWRFHAASGSLASMGYSDAPILLAAAFVFELLGGAALVLGWKVRIAAGGLILYLAAVTTLINWDITVALNRAFVLANLGCVAALLLIAAHGAGGVSLDKWQVRHRRSQPLGGH
ncbi:MAG: DoxX family protein [Myxococcales bacterium]